MPIYIGNYKWVTHVVWIAMADQTDEPTSEDQDGTIDVAHNESERVTSDHPVGRYDGIDVEILDRESHHGNEMVQLQAVEDGVEMSDGAGEAPWVFAEEVSE